MVRAPAAPVAPVAIAAIVAIITIVATAVLAWFAGGLTPLWPLAWIAPVPALIFAAASNLRRAALVVALGWFAGSFTLWHYLHGVLHVPALAAFALCAVQAAAFTLAALLYRSAFVRGRTGLAVLAYASTGTALEFASSLVSLHGTAGALAYTQLRFLPLLQLASVTGPWGIGFVVSLSAATLAAAWSRRATPRAALRVALPVAALVAVVLVFGALRLASGPATDTIPVGLVASDAPASPVVAGEGKETTKLLAAYADAAARLAQGGARVIVLPEKLGVVVGPAVAETDAALQDVADRTGATLVVGLIRVDPPRKHNDARIYVPHAPVRVYDKEHLLPPYESAMEPGRELAVLDNGPAPWGVAICKDMDFRDPARRYGRAGVGLMLVPAWDFDVDGAYHGHMAVMRGVENGYSVARAAKNGLLTVSDARGHVLAEVSSGAAPFATLLVPVPARPVATHYTRFGDWFGWTSVVIAASSVLALMRRTRRGGS